MHILKKISIMAISISLAAVSAFGQNTFSISGKLSPTYNGKKIILHYPVDNQEQIDSSLVKNGRFHFQGKVKIPVKANLLVKQTGEEQDIFLENLAVSISGSSLKAASVKGGQAQKDFVILRSRLKLLEEKMKPLSDQIVQYFKDNDTTAQDSIFPYLRAIRLDMDKIEEEFMIQHPDSYVSLGLLQERSFVIDVAKFEPYFNALSPKLRQTEAGKLLATKLAMAKKTDIGQPAIEFVQNNSQNVPVSLSSLRGKYVLLDFWASWCAPCRDENPNVLKAYQQFKDKNFEIIGVSLDNVKASWLKAIDHDHLPWIQVSDLKGLKNQVAVAYGVQAIPQNFLIGPDGTILAKNIRGEELHKKLAEVLNSH